MKKILTWVCLTIIITSLSCKPRRSKSSTNSQTHPAASESNVAKEVARISLIMMMFKTDQAVFAQAEYDRSQYKSYDDYLKNHQNSDLLETMISMTELPFPRARYLAIESLFEVLIKSTDIIKLIRYNGSLIENFKLREILIDKLAQADTKTKGLVKMSSNSICSTAIECLLKIEHLTAIGRFGSRLEQIDKIKKLFDLVIIDANKLDPPIVADVVAKQATAGKLWTEFNERVNYIEPKEFGVMPLIHPDVYKTLLPKINYQIELIESNYFVNGRYRTLDYNKFYRKIYDTIKNVVPQIEKYEEIFEVPYEDGIKKFTQFLVGLTKGNVDEKSTIGMAVAGMELYSDAKDSYEQKILAAYDSLIRLRFLMARPHVFEVRQTVNDSTFDPIPYFECIYNQMDTHIKGMDYLPQNKQKNGTGIGQKYYIEKIEPRITTNRCPNRPLSPEMAMDLMTINTPVMNNEASLATRGSFKIDLDDPRKALDASSISRMNLNNEKSYLGYFLKIARKAAEYASLSNNEHVKKNIQYRIAQANVINNFIGNVNQQIMMFSDQGRVDFPDSILKMEKKLSLKIPYFHSLYYQMISVQERMMQRDKQILKAQRLAGMFNDNKLDQLKNNIKSIKSIINYYQNGNPDPNSWTDSARNFHTQLKGAFSDEVSYRDELRKKEQELEELVQIKENYEESLPARSYLKFEQEHLNIQRGKEDDSWFRKAGHWGVSAIFGDNLTTVPAGQKVELLWQKEYDRISKMAVADTLLFQCFGNIYERETGVKVPSFQEYIQHDNTPDNFFSQIQKTYQDTIGCSKSFAFNTESTGEWLNLLSYPANSYIKLANEFSTVGNSYFADAIDLALVPPYLKLLSPQNATVFDPEGKFNDIDWRSVKRDPFFDPFYSKALGERKFNPSKYSNEIPLNDLCRFRSHNSNTEGMMVLENRINLWTMALSNHSSCKEITFDAYNRLLGPISMMVGMKVAGAIAGQLMKGLANMPLIPAWVASKIPTLVSKSGVPTRTLLKISRKPFISNLTISELATKYHFKNGANLLNYLYNRTKKATGFRYTKSVVDAGEEVLRLSNLGFWGLLNKTLIRRGAFMSVNGVMTGTFFSIASELFMQLASGTPFINPELGVNGNLQMKLRSLIQGAVFSLLGPIADGPAKFLNAKMITRLKTSGVAPFRAAGNLLGGSLSTSLTIFTEEALFLPIDIAVTRGMYFVEEKVFGETPQTETLGEWFAGNLQGVLTLRGFNAKHDAKKMVQDVNARIINLRYRSAYMQTWENRRQRYRDFSQARNLYHSIGYDPKTGTPNKEDALKAYRRHVNKMSPSALEKVSLDERSQQNIATRIFLAEQAYDKLFIENRWSSFSTEYQRTVSDSPEALTSKLPDYYEKYELDEVIFNNRSDEENLARINDELSDLLNAKIRNKNQLENAIQNGIGNRVENIANYEKNQQDIDSLQDAQVRFSNPESMATYDALLNDPLATSSINNDSEELLYQSR